MRLLVIIAAGGGGWRIAKRKVEGRVKVEDLDKIGAERALTCFVNADGHNLKLVCQTVPTVIVRPKNICFCLTNFQIDRSRSSEGVMRSQAPFFCLWDR